MSDNFGPGRNLEELDCERIKRLEEENRRLTGQVKGFLPLVKHFHESNAKKMSKPQRQSESHFDNDHSHKASRASQTYEGLPSRSPYDELTTTEYDSKDFNQDTHPDYHVRTGSLGHYSYPESDIRSSCVPADNDPSDLQNSIQILTSRGVPNSQLSVLKNLIDLKGKMTYTLNGANHPEYLAEYNQIIADVLTLFVNKTSTSGTNDLDDLMKQLTLKNREIEILKENNRSGQREGHGRQRKEKEEHLQEQNLLLKRKNESLVQKVADLQNVVEAAATSQSSPTTVAATGRPTAPPESLSVLNQLRDISPYNIEETTSILVQNNSAAELASEVAALRQQYLVTKDDFDKERADKETSIAEILTLKKLNQDLINDNEQYKQQLDIFREDFEREKSEKVQILRELRHSQRGRDEAGSRNWRPAPASQPAGRYERVWVPGTVQNTTSQPVQTKQGNVHYVHQYNGPYGCMAHGDVELDGNARKCP